MNSSHRPRHTLLPLLLLTLLTISGCATQRASNNGQSNGSNAPAPPIYPRVEATAPQPATPTAPRSDTSVATLALLRDSEAAMQRGDTGTAIAYVERAIRLEPRRADLWIELAKLQLPEKAVAAEKYARKALTLAGDRVDLQRDAWLVIADAKQASGDASEATAIRERFRTYRG